MKIFLGPAGLPLSSKEGTLNGIKKVKELKLQAMEIEFVRGIYLTNETAVEVGELASNLDIRLSAHAPYALNLCSSRKHIIEASKKRIFDSALRANEMKTDIVVFHAGYYGKQPDKAYNLVKESCTDLIKKFRESGIDVKLGLETTGRVSQFGELDELIKLCKEVEGCSPVIDFAHINCRTAGRLKTQEDYAKIFDKLKPLKLTHLHSHFTSAEYSQVAIGKGNERYHLEIASNKPPFEPLAEEIMKRKLDITIISESPILEIDSLQMKRVFERLGHKFE